MKNLPLRVLVTRLGEPDLIEYGIAKTPIDSAERAFEFWGGTVARRPEHEPDKEHLIAILLDTKLRPLGYEVVSTGSSTETIAHPRQILRPAVILNAYAIIVLHNHPSGDPAPSQADHRMTRQLREAATLMQISLLDHVVVGRAEGDRLAYFSFREAGVL
jgi:DNA repair protein RadC